MIKIKPLLRDSRSEDFEIIGILFKDLYDYMSAKGLVLNLVENGEQLWMKSIKSTLGKLSMLYVAYDKNEIVGFITGIIRLSPAYLGSKKIGYLSHLFIKPDYRRTKLGENLTIEIEKWFFEKNVDQIEVEVIVHNKNSINFFSKMGYEDDIIKKTKNAEIL